MIKVFEILSEFDKINPEVGFEMNNVSVMRGNGMKLKIQRYNTIVRQVTLQCYCCCPLEQTPSITS